ncbi:HNH endonuclease signature motif containing protein [Methanoculleus sp.]|uniref:HNH endonuclease n=1 Tax=Methanoculleus sp. TaxID=90427 RepID=UPI0025EC4368|nr:HNH endonuclease signature motif containing protein [Methanoculleus sp.]
MSTYLQLRLDAFDRSRSPLCGDRPDLNGFRRLCCQCPFAVRTPGRVYCERFAIQIRAQEKYALRGWKEIRDVILERDGQQCVICGGSDDLHVHHLDRDPTHDDPENLLTLCGICHARVHTELRREGGAGRVAQVIPGVRHHAVR